MTAPTEDGLRARRPSLPALVAIAATALAATGIFLFLIRHADPPGFDGYFYLLQIETLAREGRFRYPDRSLAFIPPALLARCFGMNALTAFNAALALAAALTACLAAVLATGPRLDGSRGSRRIVTVLLTGLMVLAAPGFQALAFNHYKNLVAALLFLAALGLWSRGSARDRVLAGLALAAALLTHKMALLFALTAGLVAAIHLFSSGRIRVNRPRLLVAGMAGGIAAAALFLLAHERAAAHARDLALGHLVWPSQWATGLVHLMRMRPAIAIDLALIAVALPSHLACRRRVDETRRPVLDTLAILAALPLLPLQAMDPLSPAYRLLHVAPLFSVIILMHAVGTLVSAGAAGNRIHGLAAATGSASRGLVALTVIATGFAFLYSSDPRELFPPWSRYGPLDQVRAAVPVDGTIIVHHSFKFYVAYVTRRRTTEYRPVAPAATVFRIAYIPPGRPAGDERRRLLVPLLEPVGDDYGLYRETDWQAASQAVNLRPHWKNPESDKPDHVY